MPFQFEKIQEHINYLAHDRGRGSCTPQERLAAVYARDQMLQAGITDARLEDFQGAASTYRPFSLAFLVAIMGTLLAGIHPMRWTLAMAALVSALGAWGMLAESDLADNWMRRLLPLRTSQSAVGSIKPSEDVRSTIVVCAHLDSHRTPIFYSSQTWYRLFGSLVTGAFGSMLFNAILFFVSAWAGWTWTVWIGMLAALMQVFALVMCLHADLTPFSPGANDNASGVGVALAMADRLVQQPLKNSEVWFAFTGCEEVGAYGMTAFLEKQPSSLKEKTFYIILDQVGIGGLTYLSQDGLILKRKTHPWAMDPARKVHADLPAIPVKERVGIAYTDALAATKRGLAAITLVTNPPVGEELDSGWHQMSDTAGNIQRSSIEDTYRFAMQILVEIDNAPVPGFRH